MSIYYGISKYTYDHYIKNTLNYQFWFSYMRLNRDISPETPKSGWPIRRVYCKGHHPDAGFKILTHRFDTDDIIYSPLKILLKIRLCMSDDSVQLVDLGVVDYFADDILVSEGTFFLEKEFKFKELDKVGTRDICAFDIVVHQKQGRIYGNESVMDIAVDY